MNNLETTKMQTPIEIALGVDENGMTTAKKLYEFLEMDKSHYSRWVKANIVDNEFATENEDYFYSPSMANEVAEEIMLMITNLQPISLRNFP